MSFVDALDSGWLGTGIFCLCFGYNMCREERGTFEGRREKMQWMRVDPLRVKKRKKKNDNPEARTKKLRNPTMKTWTGSDEDGVTDAQLEWLVVRVDGPFFPSPPYTKYLALKWTSSQPGPALAKFTGRFC